MNILPFVFAFIILFAIGSYTFVHSLKATIQQQFHYKSALAIDRTYASTIQGEIYEKQKGKTASKEDKEKEAKKNESALFHSPRDKPSALNNRKLNILALGSTESNPLLEKVTLALLKDIYGDTEIYKENLEHEILRTLKATLKVNPSITNFKELLTKLPESQVPLFYKLIKGTQNYTLYSKSGYPALEDFLSLETDKKPISFYQACRPVLTAAFGKQLCEQIIIEEKRKWEVDHKNQPLSKGELEQLLNKCHKNYSEYDSLFIFEKKADKSSHRIVKDEGSKLQIRLNQ